MIVQEVALSLRAALGGVRIVTRDELALFSELAQLYAYVQGPVTVYTWSPVIGAHKHTAKGIASASEGKAHPLGAMDVDEFIVKLPEWVTSKTDDPARDPNRPRAQRAKEPFVMCLVGCDAVLEEDALTRRALIEACRVAKARGALIALVGRDASVHDELTDEMPVVKHGLPSREDARPHIRGLLGDLTADVEGLLDAGQGLTLSRQLDALGVAIKRAEDEDRQLAVGDVMRFKEADMAEGALSARTPELKMSDLVGYEGLKTWLRDVHTAMSPDARKAGIPAPKGVLLAGPPGTGKSRLCEATAADMRVPWLSLDMSRVFNQYMGESERNMHEALETATRMAPCVLQVDEVDTVFSTRGADLDGGTAKRIFGSFLRWLADKKSEVFVMMTSNAPQDLDAALLRAGRLDDIFFVDLPPDEQRAGIWRYYLAQAKITGDDFETCIEHFVRGSVEFAPGEIESVVLTVRRQAFASKPRRAPTLGDVQSALSVKTPIAKSKAAEVAAMRSWAQQFARSSM